MFPLAMGQGEFVSGLGAPFAITVIGGLTMSTLLTLVIIPTLYSGLEEALHRLRYPEFNPEDYSTHPFDPGSHRYSDDNRLADMAIGLLCRSHYTDTGSHLVYGD